MITLSLLALVAGCSGGGDYTSPSEEEEALEAWQAQTLSLSGRMVDADGTPVQGVRVEVQEQSTTTDAQGAWVLEGLQRHNALLRASSEGYYDQLLPLVLTLPSAQTEVEVDDLELAPRLAGSTRFLFVGDTALGRRFLDADDGTPRDQLPEDDPTAWIQVSSPEEGSRALVQLIKPVFEAVDFPVLNLETPVTNDPSTPHQTKPYAFFTLPRSLVFLEELGITYVGLGNNHVYDYLQPGLDDTLDHLDAANVAWSGAGATPEEAATPWVLEADGHRYAMLSFTSIDGDEHEIVYVANEEQGGAADLHDDELVEATWASVQSDAIIAQLHVGNEYAPSPSDYTRRWMSEAVERGSDLVVAHHPHVAQGFEVIDGVLVAHCLGNFLLDQDRLETFPALLLQVDLEGEQLHRARALPMALDEYQPLLVGGERTARMVRGVGEVSGDGLEVVLHAGQIWLVQPDDPRLVVKEREVRIPLTVERRGWEPVDLRAWLEPGESAAEVHVEGLDVSALTAGRDLMGFGDFEDEDLDGDLLEGDRWDLGGSSRDTCLGGAWRGTAGLCSWRDATNIDPSVAAFRNRIRPPVDDEGQPLRELSLLARVQLIGAGASELRVDWWASVGEARFGEQHLDLGKGDADWHLWSADLDLPADEVSDPWDEEQNPRALRVFVSQEPPRRGWGQLHLDDVAVVVWDQPLQAEGGELSTPHARDFLRVEAGPGEGEVVVTARSVSLEL